MHIWVRPEDTPSLAFVAPPHPSDTKTLIDFHLSLPMGYVDSPPYFCCNRKTIKDIAKEIWGACFSHRHTNFILWLYY